MDYNKIGKFIMLERKAKKMTQAKLAEKLFVSEKTISKWENGNGVPDTETLPKLCEAFGVSINELLNGERISASNYKNNAESKLIELMKQNEVKNKKLLSCTNALMIISMLSFLGILVISCFAISNEILILIVNLVATIVLIISFCFCFKIEVNIMNYECQICKHRFTPKYFEALFAFHTPRKRYLKCPHCKNKSWAKRVISE